MKIIHSLIILLLLGSFSAGAQVKWSTETIKKANTAKDAEYLTEQEKDVIYYTNLVRLDPKGFAKLLKHYIDSTGEKNGYTSSLLSTLAAMAPVQPLQPDKELYLIAKAHAINYGNSGKTGHDNLRKRFANYMKGCGCKVSENADYGYEEALDIVMHLLIDTGIKDLGHRKNMLDPQIRNIGVSIQPHKRYRWNCVMDFSSR